MSKDLNQVTLIGNLTKDPEIKYTSSGMSICNFSIANNNSYKQNDQLVEYVNYFDVTVWGNQAVSCEKYLSKGKKVAVNGSLRQDRWQDKTDGKTRSKVIVNANSVQFLSVSGENSNNPPANNKPEDPWKNENASFKDQDAQPENTTDENIPF